MTTKVSVVVCTYNRAAMLKGCLESILHQECDVSIYEVIVIDNNSTDNTRCVTNDFASCPYFRYILETQQGLSHARNRGIMEATGDYLAFFDDDVLIPGNWISNLLRLTDKHMCLDGLGGPLFPFYTSQKPDWYEDQYSVQMGNRTSEYYLEPNHCFIGANMVWKREFIRSIGGFRVDLGYKGEEEYLGEDTEAFVRAWKAKPAAKFLFSPELRIKHWWPAEKMKLGYRVKRKFSEGLYKHHIFLSKSPGYRLNYLLRLAMLFSRKSVKAILALPKYSYWQKWVFLELGPVAAILGEICGVVGKRPYRRYLPEDI